MMLHKKSFISFPLIPPTIFSNWRVIRSYSSDFWPATWNYIFGLIAIHTYNARLCKLPKKEWHQGQERGRLIPKIINLMAKFIRSDKMDFGIGGKIMKTI